jgi:hypothetical protein
MALECAPPQGQNPGLGASARSETIGEHSLVRFMVKAANDCQAALYGCRRKKSEKHQKHFGCVDLATAGHWIAKQNSAFQCFRSALFLFAIVAISSTASNAAFAGGILSMRLPLIAHAPLPALLSRFPDPSLRSVRVASTLHRTCGVALSAMRSETNRAPAGPLWTENVGACLGGIGPPARR